MQVRSNRLGVATYLTPDGALVEENLTDLEKEVQAARAAGASNLVVDLHRVTFCDSPSLEYLLDLCTSLREEGGSLRLAAAQSTTKEVLTITRLDQSIPVYDDLESAGRSFL